MQRAKARASPSGPTAKRFKAESSPNAARTRMTQTPKRRKEHNEEEEEEEDEGSPVAKRNKASDLTVAPTLIPQGTEEEEEEEGGGANATPTRSSARLRARTASARTAQASEPESEGDAQSPKRHKRSDPDEDKWATDDILLTLTTDAMMCEALIKVLTHIVQAAGAFRAPTADNESTYEAKKAGVPAENPTAVHRLFMLLYQIPSARAARAKEMRERVEPLIGTVKAAKGEPKAEGELNILRALSFVMDGAYRKVAPALTSNGNADLDDDDVRKGIELLYPRADRVTGIKQDAVDDLAHQPFEASEVIAYLATRRRRTAASGWKSSELPTAPGRERTHLRRCSRHCGSMRSSQRHDTCTSNRSTSRSARSTLDCDCNAIGLSPTASYAWPALPDVALPDWHRNPAEIHHLRPQCPRDAPHHPAPSGRCIPRPSGDWE
jgi:hypothetical protein